MPLVFSNPQFPNQTGASPFEQSFSTEHDYGMLLREATGWNPNCDPLTAGRFVNERYRQVIRRRSWYGTKVRGIVSVPNLNQIGIAATVSGSNTVTGTGTNWTPALVGAQFRQAFTYPFQTITAVNQSAQTLTLDTPSPGPSATGPFQIAQVYVNFGANVKRILWAVNQQQGWPMNVRTPVESLNEWDVWRQSQGWSRHMATRAPQPDGSFQVEIWPIPYTQQAFPFECYAQPPEMVADSDAPLAWIDTDVIMSGAVCDVLRYRPKANPYYSEQAALTIAASKEQEFEKKIGELEMSDNDLDQQDVTWDYGQENGPTDGDGTAFAQTHDF